MAALTTNTIADAGTAPVFEAVSSSDTAQVGSGRNTFVVYKNDSAGAVNVTVEVPGDTFFGVAKQDNVIAVAAGEEAWIPLRKAYDDGSGNATILTDTQASVTAAVVRYV